MRRGGREAPKEERDYAAPDPAEEHHPRVRVAVAQVAEDDLAKNGRRVKDGCDDDSCERCGQRRREGGDVERDREVREPLEEEREGLHAPFNQ